MTNFGHLGKLHSDIWWNHDLREFVLLEESAKSFLIELSYGEAQSKKAARHISRSYFFYDEAVNAVSFQSKAKYFELVEKEHALAIKTLGGNPKLGRYYFLWWYYFSLRRLPSYLFFLLLYHYVSVPLRYWLFIPLVFLFVAAAGVAGHNARNKELTEKGLVAYWRATYFFGLNKKQILY